MTELPITGYTPFSPLMREQFFFFRLFFQQIGTFGVSDSVEEPLVPKSEGKKRKEKLFLVFFYQLRTIDFGVSDTNSSPTFTFTVCPWNFLEAQIQIQIRSLIHKREIFQGSL